MARPAVLAFLTFLGTLPVSHAHRVWASGSAAASARNRAVLRGARATSYPTCSCDCCDVVERRPDEYVDGAAVKCAPVSAGVHEACAEQCTPQTGDAVLQTAEDQVLDYFRFCFFECKPADGIVSVPQTQCIELEPEEVKQVVDKTGNAIDPARIYSRPAATPQAFRAIPVQQVPTARELYAERATYLPGSVESGFPPPPAAFVVSGTSLRAGEVHEAFASAPAPAPMVAASPVAASPVAASPVAAPVVAPAAAIAPAPASGGSPAPAQAVLTPEEAREEALGGIAIARTEANDARREAESLRAHEAGEARKLHERLSYEVGGAGQAEGAQVGIDQYQMLDDIRSMSQVSEVSAAQAAQSAKEAVEAFKAARRTNWETAIDTAKDEMIRIKKVSDKKAKDLLKAPPVTWAMRAQKKVMKASKPFLDQILRAQESAKLYNARSDSRAADTRRLDAEAKSLTAEANELNKALRGPEALLKLQGAMKAHEESLKAAELSKSDASVAAETLRAIPMLYAQAQTAANMAVAAMS